LANQRYIYERMTPEQFKAAQEQIGIGGYTLARLLGYPYNRIKMWEDGEADIPHSVLLNMSLLTLPGAKEMAWAITERAIKGRVEDERKRDA
jgi:DNA-binding transcriptional regulator YiaG